MQKLVMLTKTDEFSSVFSFRKRVSQFYLTLHYLPQQQDCMRVGFVVAKRVAKRAVDRNYMRRVLRTLSRKQAIVHSGLDVVIQVQKPFSHKDYKNVSEEMSVLLDKLKRRISVEAVN